MARTKEVRKQQIVNYQGEASYVTHIIERGIIRVYTILPTGSEMNVAILGEGDYFPIETAYEIAPATMFYYEALTDATIRDTSVDEFREERAANPQTPDIDSRRYIGALLHVNALGQTSASDKLAHTFRYLAIRFGVQVAAKSYIKINVRLTQQDIANLCALSRETVSIELAQLRDKNIIIEKAKHYTVHLPRLTSMLGEDSNPELELALLEG